MSIRQCLVEPISAIFDAATTLNLAVDAHLEGNRTQAEALFMQANDPAVWTFTDAAWGRGAKQRHAFVIVPDAPPYFAKPDRPSPRMPTTETRTAVINRDGFHCRFCGMPVIDPSIRTLVIRCYPSAVNWGRTNDTQHAAFQCMWLQCDHVLPNCRGGTSDLENVIVTCAPCNFGRMDATLEEACLVNPLSRPIPRKWSGFDTWDGLVRFKQQTPPPSPIKS